MNDVLFWFGRHGSTPGNDAADPVYRAWSNDEEADLSSKGKDEARQLGLWFYNNRIPIDAIISDNLNRVKHSSEIIAEILGLKPNQLHLTSELHPLDVGEYTLKSKAKYPLDEYLKNPKKKIPGGESVDGFDDRQTKFFGKIINLVDGHNLRLLVMGHGSNISYLNNRLFNRTGQERVGYEGLVNPGGLVMATDDGLYPITQVRGDNQSKFKDGTALTGFVTVETNRPPRSCWNCRAFQRDAQGGYCTHPLVKIDPQLQAYQRTDNNISVADDSCCDNFRNHIST